MHPTRTDIEVNKLFFTPPYIFKGSSKIYDRLSFMWKYFTCYFTMGYIFHNDERKFNEYIDGLVQERRNSIANALELRLSCTNPRYCMCWFMLSRVHSGWNSAMITLTFKMKGCKSRIDLLIYIGHWPYWLVGAIYCKQPYNTML